MITATNLRHLIAVMDARLALIGPAKDGEDPEVTAQRDTYEARRRSYVAQLAEQTSDQRLPYRDEDL